MKRAGPGIAIALALTGSPTLAQEVLIRADLPLWTNYADTHVFPTRFVDEESFGCVSNVRFGDYRRIETGESEPSDWWRIDNYGVNHCALLLSEAPDQDRLENRFRDYAWVIVLDEVQTPVGEVELLALQIGARGGSEYRLLSRPKADATNATISVLNPACPRAFLRDAGSLDVWRTDYCVVASQSALRRLAREAVRRPPAAILEYVRPEPVDGPGEP